MDETTPKLKNGFLQDAQGDNSSKRLESFTCLIFAIFLACWGKITHDLPAVTQIVCAFLVASAGFQGVSAVQDGFGTRKF